MVEGLKSEELAQRGIWDDAGGGDDEGEPLVCLGCWASGVGSGSWGVAEASSCFGGNVGDSGRPGGGCFCSWAKGGAVGPDVSVNGDQASAKCFPIRKWLFVSAA